MKLAPDLAHRAVARLFGEGQPGGRFDARGVPEDFVDGGDGVCGANRVLYGDVQIGEEARVDLTVRRQPEPRAPRAEGF
jgi:hypothetical protein